VDGRLLHAHRYYDAPPRLRDVIKEVRWRQSHAAVQLVVVNTNS